jgi:dTDP-D-glucose 4,6-dehydratase
MHVLLTGGAGFIASHIVEHIRATRPDWRISIIDRLNYAGSLDRLARWRADEHIQFLFHDFRASFNIGLIAKLGKVNAIIHAGAETHVDNSLPTLKSLWNRMSSALSIYWKLLAPSRWISSSWFQRMKSLAQRLWG